MMNVDGTGVTADWDWTRGEMRQLIRKTLQLATMLVVVAVGCAKAGSEYVGKWVSTRNSADTLDITRSGEQFQITGATLQQMSATYTKDGVLQIPGPIGMSISLKYDKGTDTLQGPGMSAPTVYKRIK